MSSDLYGTCSSPDVIVMSRTDSYLPYGTQCRRNALTDHADIIYSICNIFHWEQEGALVKLIFSCVMQLPHATLSPIYSRYCKSPIRMPCLKENRSLCKWYYLQILVWLLALSMWYTIRVYSGYRINTWQNTLHGYKMCRIRRFCSILPGIFLFSSITSQ